MEILNNLQKDILRLFPGILESGHFYLTGGTALSYFYLKHRRSNDLDFFTSTEELISPFSYRLEQAMKEKGINTQRQKGLHSFVELLAEKNNEKTVIHLACDSPFRLKDLEEFPEYPKLKVDNLVDISANKLLALFGRATLRDFIDIYFLVKKKKFSFEELIRNAKAKDSGFDLYWLGVALERINTFNKNSPEMLLMLEPVDFDSLLNFFNQWRKKIAESLFQDR